MSQAEDKKDNEDNSSSAKSPAPVAAKRSWQEINELVDQYTQYVKSTGDNDDSSDSSESDEDGGPGLKDVRPRCTDPQYQSFATGNGCDACDNCEDASLIENLACGRNVCRKLRKRRYGQSVYDQHDVCWLRRVNNKRNPHASCMELVEGLVYVLRQTVAKHGLQGKVPGLDGLFETDVMNVADFLADFDQDE